ncbi:MAG: ABC transporter permease [bacterium]|nr:ABC transporter permease [bacterium]
MTQPRLMDQAIVAARRDLARERRRGEVLWVTIPFGVVAMLLIPMAVGADAPRLRELGPGLFWVIVLLFGVLVTVRTTAADTPQQRDLNRLIGLDPAAGFVGRSLASFVLLLAFEVVVGLATIALYDVSLAGWFWLPLILVVAGAGLALIGSLAASIAGNLATGPALVPLLVAPLAVPLLLGATQALDGLRLGNSILPWLLLMVTVVLVLLIVGVLTARPLQETR